MQGIFRKFREKREDGWSNNIYEGIFFNLTNPDVPVILAKLSHGLRVLPAKSDDEYLFLEERSVNLDDPWLRLAGEAYWPDQNLQRGLIAYDVAVAQ